ncbi:MAG: hypothetical protein HY812_21055 [Planctomycetes bacterium]|nr:hypothetical protein [Planctomycetota bacterium]
MRYALLLVLAACTLLPRHAPQRSPLPDSLAVFLMNEHHPAMSPVLYTHARHVDPAVMGRQMACAECHHTLKERPDEIPASCGDCHPQALEAGEHDESLPHDEAQPPDL